MKFFKKYGAAIACVIFLGSIYLPFIISGGLIADDWSTANTAYTHPGVVPTYQALFGPYSNRPLAPLIFSLVSNAVGTAAFCWIILNLAFWLAGLLIIANILNEHVSRRAGILFFLFAAVPAFSSTLILSPAVMIMGSVSVCFWAISLYSLLRYIRNKKLIWYVSTYGFLALSLFAYEATLPLFAITALLPLVFEKFNLTKSDFIRYVREYILPVIAALAVVLLYQKVIVPNFFPDISRLRFRGLVIIPAVLLKFALVIIADIPALLASGLARVGKLALATTVPLLAVGAWLCWRWRKNVSEEPTDSSSRNNFHLLLIFILAGLGSIALYILAGTVPTIHGYDNRGLISFTVALAGVLALLGELGYRRSRPLLYAVIGVLLLSAVSFALQRDNYIRTAQIQNAILADIAQKTESQRVPPADTVFVNVPGHLRDNYNNEIIFSDELGASLAGIPLTKRRLDTGRAKIDGQEIVSDGFRAPIASAWYYQSDEDLRSSLIKIRDTGHARAIVDAIREEPVGAVPFDLFRTGAEWYISHINIPDLKPLYKQYLDRWGYN